MARGWLRQHLLDGREWAEHDARRREFRRVCSRALAIYDAAFARRKVVAPAPICACGHLATMHTIHGCEPMVPDESAPLGWGTAPCDCPKWRFDRDVRVDPDGKEVRDA